MTMQAITGYQSFRRAAIKTPRELPLWEIQAALQHFESSLYASFNFSERTTLVPIFTRSKKSEKETVNCMKKGKRQRQHQSWFWSLFSEAVAISWSRE